MGFLQKCTQARVPSILILGALYATYVLVGGVVFWQLEGRLVQEDINRILAEKVRILNTYPCLEQEGLEAVSVVIQKALKAGVSVKSNSSMDGLWKFSSSAVFAATVVTTIGYGNMSPRTTAGQIFCVFFALFGIPLNMVVLNRVGKYMLVIGRKTCDILQAKTNHRRCTRFIVHLVSYVCGAALFFVFPMMVFEQQEGWAYSKGVYYCFITLSTIGFGDYVADSNPDRVYPGWYNVLMASWIFFGLAWLALIINHSIDILERLNSHVKHWWEPTDDSQDEEPVVPAPAGEEVKEPPLNG